MVNSGPMSLNQPDGTFYPPIPGHNNCEGWAIYHARPQVANSGCYSANGRCDCDQRELYAIPNQCLIADQPRGN